MDDIIQKIIDFETSAQSIVNTARDERRKYEDTIRLEIEAYRNETAANNKAKIESFAKQMKKEADETVKHLEDAAKLKIAQMQMTAASHKNEWIEQLLNILIKGEQPN